MAEAITIAFALAMLVVVARRMIPARPVGAAFLVVLAVAWTWANLRTTGWEAELNEDAPAELDPFTRAMFYRGWPLAPFMFCMIHGLRFRPRGDEGLLLAFDWAVLYLGLVVARFSWERCSRRPTKTADVMA